MRPMLCAMSLMMLALVGCSGIRVHQDYDLKQDFSAYRTYDWKSLRKSKDGGAAEALGARRVVQTVDAALAQKGLKLDRGDKPDLLLYLETRWEKHRVRSSVTVGTRVGWGPMRMVTRTQGPVRTYREGSLILEMTDARSGEVVWVGEAEDVFQPGMDPQDAESRVQEAVRRLLEGFPPHR